MNNKRKGIYTKIENPLLEIKIDASPDVLEAEMEKIRPDYNVLYVKYTTVRKDYGNYYAYKYACLYMG